MAGFTHAPDGKPIGRTLANGTATGYEYDSADQLTAMRHLMNTTSLQRFDYVLDAVGNRTSRQESGASFSSRTDAYNYDPADQLTEVKYAFDAGTSAHSRKVTYSYDPAGNRQSVVEDADGTGPGGPVTVPYVANDLNHYTSIDGLAAPLHDDNGNLTRHQARLADPVWTYTYDAQNRLVGGTSTAGGGFTFAYDARNRCVVRTINGATTVNFYDGWSLIDERSGTDTSLARYIHGGGLDEVLARVTSTGTVYYQHDGLGSTTALTDSAGNVVERVTYDAYGLPSFFDASGASIAGSAYGNRFLFTGREWFAGLRLNDHRNRFYSADTGRWLSRDPIEEEGGINLYGYVKNNVLSAVDLFGLIDWIGKAASDARDEMQKTTEGRKTIADVENLEKNTGKSVTVVCLDDNWYYQNRMVRLPKLHPVVFTDKGERIQTRGQQANHELIHAKQDLDGTLPAKLKEADPKCTNKAEREAIDSTNRMYPTGPQRVSHAARLTK